MALSPELQAPPGPPLGQSDLSHRHIVQIDPSSALPRPPRACSPSSSSPHCTPLSTPRDLRPSDALGNDTKTALFSLSQAHHVTSRLLLLALKSFPTSSYSSLPAPPHTHLVEGKRVWKPRKGKVNPHNSLVLKPPVTPQCLLGKTHTPQPGVQALVSSLPSAQAACTGSH